MVSPSCSAGPLLMHRRKRNRGQFVQQGTVRSIQSQPRGTLYHCVPNYGSKMRFRLAGSTCSTSEEDKAKGDEGYSSIIMAESLARDKEVLTVEPGIESTSNGSDKMQKNENERMVDGSEMTCQRRSLIRTLNPRFALVLVHGVVGCPFPLPRVGGVKFHLLQDGGFRELLHCFPRRQDGLQMVNLALIEGIGELDAKFDVKVTGFVVSLRGHALAMDHFQVTWRVSSVERRQGQDGHGLPS